MTDIMRIFTRFINPLPRFRPGLVLVRMKSEVRRSALGAAWLALNAIMRQISSPPESRPLPPPGGYAFTRRSGMKSFYACLTPGKLLIFDWGWGAAPDMLKYRGHGGLAYV